MLYRISRSSSCQSSVPNLKCTIVIRGYTDTAADSQHKAKQLAHHERAYHDLKEDETLLAWSYQLTEQLERRDPPSASKFYAAEIMQFWLVAQRTVGAELQMVKPHLRVTPWCFWSWMDMPAESTEKDEIVGEPFLYVLQIRGIFPLRAPKRFRTMALNSSTECGQPLPRRIHSARCAVERLFPRRSWWIECI